MILLFQALEIGCVIFVAESTALSQEALVIIQKQDSIAIVKKY